MSTLDFTDNFFEKIIRAVKENLTVLHYGLSHFSIKKSLIPFLFILFIISFATPLSGHIFSGFVAWLCVIIPLLKRSVYLPVAFIILFISNVFDPNILFIKSPFHFGILEFINPSQLFGVGATIRICFDIFVKLYGLGKISYLHMAYLLLFAFSVATSFYGFQDDNARKLQSLMFLFNISVCLWFYESFLNLDQRNISNLIRLLKGLGVTSLILYVFNFPNTHISFFFIALSTMTIYAIVKSNKWYWYLLIPLVVHIVLKASIYLSVTTAMIIAFSILIGALSLKKTLFTNGLINLIIIGTIITHVLFFSLPLIELPSILTKDLTAGYAYYDDTKSILDRVLFKLSLDRWPLWLGAIDGIKENYLFTASGSSFIPANFGTFGSPDRQIEWVAGAHQFVLELMLNYGLIGAVLYWLIWLSFMKKLYLAIFSKNCTIKYLSVSLLAYFIPTSFVANFMIQEHAFAAWAIMGVTFALYKRDLYFNKKNAIALHPIYRT